MPASFFIKTLDKRFEYRPILEFKEEPKMRKTDKYREPLKYNYDY